MFKKTTTRIAAIAIAMTAAMTGLSSTASASSMTNNSQTVICRTAEHTVSSTAAMKAPVVNGPHHYNRSINVNKNKGQAKVGKNVRNKHLDRKVLFDVLFRRVWDSLFK